MLLSIVIPVFNEEDSLRALHGEIQSVAREHNYELDLIFIDDGSTDGSWAIIEQIVSRDPSVSAVRFRRNFGKAAALNAGFARARGPRVMTLDADLQDDPHEIPRFLEKMDSGFDVVSGWKQVRHDPWHKVLPSRIFNRLVSTMTGVHLHDHNCGMKCYERAIFDEVQLYGELHRFVPVLAAARGFTAGEVVVNHRPRKFGHSKYGVSRFIKGLLDLATVRFLSGYGQRPQHVLGTLGLMAFAVGALLLTYLGASWLLSRMAVLIGLVTVPAGVDPAAYYYHIGEHPTLALFSVAPLLLGGQLIAMGLLGELFIANRETTANQYSVARELGADRNTEGWEPADCAEGASKQLGKAV